jgi:hypothetical protein
MSAATHANRFETKLPQHGESRNTYFVSDCRCGWLSPLCATEERAHALFVAHQRRARRKRSA